MGAVTVMLGDEVIFEAAFGRATGNVAQATPDHLYATGSITKTYTAVMILLLVEEGLLSLDTKLDMFYPDIINADRITIEQLLRHQSGLTNFTNLPDYSTYYTEPRSKKETLAYFASLDAKYDPGTSTEYSNTGYVILGYIIEDVTGKSYGDALKSLITEPLDFSSTRMGPGDMRTDSFNFQQGDWQKAPETDMSIPHGAGAIHSTARETALFYRSLLTGEILEESALREMTHYVGPFGIGLIRFPFYDYQAVGHNGGIDGYQSNAAYFTGQDITYCILANGVNYPFNDILTGLLRIVFDMDFEIPAFDEIVPVELPESELERYTGTCRSPGFPLEIMFMVQDGQLYSRATGQEAFPLTTLDELTIVFEPAGIEIRFEPVDNGRYTSFELKQAGMSFQFSRTE